MSHTKIPTEELEVLKSLKDIKVVFDVGARTDTDYLDLLPEATFHLFEPNPNFVKELKDLTKGRKNVIINEFGLGDKEEIVPYDEGRQAFIGGESPAPHFTINLLLKRLDRYCAEKEVKFIDFLKIDAEGYDFKVLIGAGDMIKNCKYIQYEHWDNKFQFHELLGEYFVMDYIGYRNVLCTRKQDYVYNPIVASISALKLA